MAGLHICWRTTHRLSDRTRSRRRLDSTRLPRICFCALGVPDGEQVACPKVLAQLRATRLEARRLRLELPSVTPQPTSSADERLPAGLRTSTVSTSYTEQRTVEIRSEVELITNTVAAEATAELGAAEGDEAQRVYAAIAAVESRVDATSELLTNGRVGKLLRSECEERVGELQEELEMLNQLQELESQRNAAGAGADYTQAEADECLSQAYHSKIAPAAAVELLHELGDKLGSSKREQKALARSVAAREARVSARRELSDRACRAQVCQSLMSAGPTTVAEAVAAVDRRERAEAAAALNCGDDGSFTAVEQSTVPVSLLASPFLPERDHVVDVSTYATTPLRFTTARMLTTFTANASSIEVEAALVCPDTGGGGPFIGEGLVIDLEREYPDMFQGDSYSKDELKTKAKLLGGIGGVTLVRRYVDFRIEIGGGVVRAVKMPVIAGFYGICLGNHFNHELSAEYTYDKCSGEATFCYNHDYYGKLSTRAEYLSRKVEMPPEMASFLVAGAVQPLAFVGEPIIVPGRVGDEYGRTKLHLRVPPCVEDGAVVLLEAIDDPRWNLHKLVGVAGVQTVTDGYVNFEVINADETDMPIGAMTPCARFRIQAPPSEFEAHEVESAIHIGEAARTAPGGPAKVLAFLEKHKGVFRTSLRESYCHVAQFSVDQIDPTKICRDPPILRRSAAEEAEYLAHAEKTISDGLGYIGESEHGCDPLLIAKRDQDGTVLPEKRQAHDYRSQNANTKDSAWPLPDILRNMARIRGKIYCVLDLLTGFSQFEMHPDSKKFTAVYTPLGLLIMHRMPFGLKGAPAFFCKAVQRILEGLTGVVSYVDDVCAFGKDLDDLLEIID